MVAVQLHNRILGGHLASASASNMTPTGFSTCKLGLTSLLLDHVLRIPASRHDRVRNQTPDHHRETTLVRAPTPLPTPSSVSQREANGGVLLGLLLLGEPRAPSRDHRRWALDLSAASDRASAPPYLRVYGHCNTLDRCCVYQPSIFARTSRTDPVDEENLFEHSGRISVSGT